ncbi:MAG: hypothetical protein A2075_15630 [Geobacteraceae bacterium GWC2_58_44]|nr:MAG: hypothetical protein A2075_15630 [Geobacteraceae bacterium GWC2_58_44]HBG06015.1 hypothetical protein [Geobacter sp.]
MKLHLGCGQRYLDGYLNIDFPPSSHTVQTEDVADLHADITALRYPAQSVDEVRLHHVFEHFPRPVACGLMACWHSWLRPGGVLHIEVPDFARTARVMLNPLASFKNRAVAERHLFGSHEAPWAVHCEGYTPAMLKTMIAHFGFGSAKLTRNSWRGTFNVELVCSKGTASLHKEELVPAADRYLKDFLVDMEASEMRVHAVWMASFKEQLEKGWAS